MTSLAGRRAVVIGLGVSGLAAARALIDEGATVRVSEERPAAEIERAAELERLGAELLAGGHEQRHLEGADLVVVSPGVKENAPVIGWALGRGLPVWSELELGASLCRAPYVGVTGTNGKTTTTEMIAAAMGAGGLDAVACGNVGYPFATAAREDHDALVVEASSFQLRFHESFHPRVSVLLNLAEDHLDWHSSFEAYASAKSRIFALQSEDDVHVGNADDPAAAGISDSARCRRVWFRQGEPQAEGEAGFVDGSLTMRSGDGISELGRPISSASGFRADAAAALTASVAFGIDPARAGKTICAFRPLPHRGEVVAAAGSVRFIDDSKATNPHAALAALEGLSDVVLIAGGVSKGVDLSPLGEAARRLAGVVAIGEASEELKRIFSGRVEFRAAGGMQEAVEAAVRIAPDGGTVLLAPACASQDMFTGYAERGSRFADAAARVAESRVRG